MFFFIKWLLPSNEPILTKLSSIRRLLGHSIEHHHLEIIQLSWRHVLYQCVFSSCWQLQSGVCVGYCLRQFSPDTSCKKPCLSSLLISVVRTPCLKLSALRRTEGNREESPLLFPKAEIACILK